MGGGYETEYALVHTGGFQVKDDMQPFKGESHTSVYAQGKKMDADDLDEVIKRCKKLGCPGFVVKKGVAYFVQKERRQILDRDLKEARGITTYIYTASKPLQAYMVKGSVHIACTEIFKILSLHSLAEWVAVQAKETNGEIDASLVSSKMCLEMTDVC